jgi:hypothetical protein
MILLAVSTELDSAREYYREKKRCLLCDIIEQELKVEERILSQNDDFDASSLCLYRNSPGHRLGLFFATVGQTGGVPPTPHHPPF